MRCVLAVVVLALSSPATAQRADACLLDAIDAYGRAFDDCMGARALRCRDDFDCAVGDVCVLDRCVPDREPAPSCGDYTRHGAYACRDHFRCNWSDVSRQCFDRDGLPCGAYTIHGEYACRDNLHCNWSRVSQECYDL
jgi:hypothetical protein